MISLFFFCVAVLVLVVSLLAVVLRRTISLRRSAELRRHREAAEHAIIAHTVEPADVERHSVESLCASLGFGLTRLELFEVREGAGWSVSR